LAKKKSLPWALCKGFKTFLPVSHFIPKEKIPDPHDVELYLKVNGELRQSDSTKLMLFDIPRLLQHVTSVAPLEEDDLLLTGTPKGVGPVKPGDVITAGIKVNGTELEEGRVEVKVEERAGGYSIAV
jgi:acylpyruvate hydrolase